MDSAIKSLNTFFIIVAICLISGMFFVSCHHEYGPHSSKNKKPVYEHEFDVLKNKRDIIQDGDTKFVFALESGETHTVTYGEYEKYDQQDTLCFERKKGYITWNLRDCDCLHRNDTTSYKPRLENP